MKVFIFKIYDFFIIPFAILSLGTSIHYQGITIVVLRLNPKSKISPQIINKVQSIVNYKNTAANMTWGTLYDMQTQAKLLIQSHWGMKVLIKLEKKKNNNNNINPQLRINFPLIFKESVKQLVRGKGGKREVGERNISLRDSSTFCLPHMPCPRLGSKTATQLCVLDQNQTHNSWVHRLML